MELLGREGASPGGRPNVSWLWEAHIAPEHYAAADLQRWQAADKGKKASATSSGPKHKASPYGWARAVVEEEHLVGPANLVNECRQMCDVAVNS